METIFDILAGVLFLATLGLYILRRRHERAPLGPYALIGAVCLVGAWLGNNGGGLAAISLLMGGWFLSLYLAGRPYRNKAES